MVRFTLILIFALLANELDAQVNAFARSNVDKKSVLVEQPVKVRVMVFSPTWFAAPLNIGNLQVEGAFVQSFKRTQSSIQYINKKKYAALEFYYILFPYRDGKLIFPELSIQASIPPEGDYKGLPVTLKTEPIHITVQPVPKDADADNWLVATDAFINDEWSAALDDLKVGDVLSRTITIRAEGTLPTFIDEPVIGSVDFASLYTSEPKFYDDRDNQQAKGRRVDTYSYLFEEAGSFTLPGVEVKWWNPYLGRYYSRSLPEYELLISENEDLHALNQLRDSLQALNPAMLMEEEAETEGFSWRDLLRAGLILLLVVLVLWLVYRAAKKIRSSINAKKQEKYNSEAYWFRKMLKQENEEDMLNHLYHWIDRSEMAAESHTLNSLNSIDPELRKALTELKKAVYSEKQPSNSNMSMIKKHLSNIRATRLRWMRNPTKHMPLKNLNP